MSHINEHFTRIALACEKLDLTLSHNGRQTYRLLSGQGVRDRVAVLFGQALAEDLIETSRAERGMQIRAFLAKPSAARASGAYQYLFLNGRFIRDKFILHAVKEAYRGLMEPNRYPVVFLFIQMPPEDFDVNVHPTKVEVRFDNANLVHSEVLSVLRDKLLSANLDVGGAFPADRAVAFDLPPSPIRRMRPPANSGFSRRCRLLRQARLCPSAKHVLHLSLPAPPEVPSPCRARSRLPFRICRLSNRRPPRCCRRLKMSCKSTTAISSCKR
jgi:hypothetical protein